MTSHLKLTLLTLLLGCWLYLAPLPIRAQSDPYSTDTLGGIDNCSDAAYAASHCSCLNACKGVPANSEF